MNDAPTTGMSENLLDNDEGMGLNAQSRAQLMARLQVISQLRLREREASAGNRESQVSKKRKQDNESEVSERQ